MVKEVVSAKNADVFITKDFGSFDPSSLADAVKILEGISSKAKIPLIGSRLPKSLLSLLTFISHGLIHQDQGLSRPIPTQLSINPC